MIRNNICKNLLISILLSLSVSLAGQQTIRVTGKVMNTSGEALSDVAVNYSGSAELPVITDSSGEFTISVPSGDVWMTVSPVDIYKTRKVFLNSRTDINVYLLKTDEESIHDEMQIMGADYQLRDLASGVSTGKGGIAGENTWQTFDQNLQGKVPGLYQSTLSGMPGAGSYMLLRGLNSIFTVNQPLIIVDGIPLENPGIINSVVSGYNFNPLASLDPNDISSMAIVRDGSALTTYGIKGSNGLIIIETLKPVETNTSIDFQYKAGMSVSDHELPQMGAYDYKTYAKEILSSSAFKEELYEWYYPGLYYLESDDQYIRYSHDTNWQNQVFRNSLVQDAYITVKGGDAIARYGLSVGYLNHNGIIDNSNYNRVSSRFVGTFNIFSGLRMFVSANLVSTNAEYKESALGEQTSPILSALTKSPQMFPQSYDQDDKQLDLLDDVDELGVSNPRAIIESYSAGSSSYRFLTSFKIEGDITQKLRWNSILGLNINDMKEVVFMPNYGMELYFDQEAYNASQYLNNLLFTVSNDNYLSYNVQLNEIHKIYLRAGAKWQTNNYQDDLGLTMNSNENDQYKDLGSGDNQLRFISGRHQKWNWLSNYYSGHYVFRDKYIASASLSADFSSRIGKLAENTISIGGQPFGIFYNVGLAWRMSDETFMSAIQNVADVKLKLNYGTSGNDDVGTSNTFRNYRLKLFRETSGMIPGGFANDELTFEKMSQLSVGLDAAVLENRLNLTAAYFRSATSNMFILENIPVYIGYEYFPSSSGKLSNNGYEVGMNARLIQSSDFSLDIGFNLSHFKSVIREVPDNEVITELPGGGSLINRVGEQANCFFGYEFLGVYSTSEDAANAGLLSETGIPYKQGDAVFRDISGPDGRPDSIINEYDKTILGSANPDYFGGMSLKVNFRRLELFMHWQFTYGNEVYNYLRYQNEKMSDLSNQSAAVLNRWVYEGQITQVPRSLWNDPVGNSAFSSRWIEDGSYARLKQLTLSYRINEDFLIFRNFKVFVTASNLITFSNYLSYDPESSYSFDPKMQGIDYGLMPAPKTIMAGVKFGL